MDNADSCSPTYAEKKVTSGAMPSSYAATYWGRKESDFPKQSCFVEKKADFRSFWFGCGENVQIEVGKKWRFKVRGSRLQDRQMMMSVKFRAESSLEGFCKQPFSEGTGLVYK
ncbi:hypothetical protein AMTR_s00071p00124830 [Amborella trichopoda]|uniref:Uncharacterized protein n=1 Tax=Amborella trichopoda TaxID=13333 RepID=U5DBQ1_AMBTC|nr:hypothetical protein AMTR_s00071p00124830 [Amborella trichopoda]